jgi:LytS/YehU family sensor histidine kinase
VDFYNKVFLAWSIITPYLVLFLFNNYVLIPLLLNRGHIFKYVVAAFAVVTSVFIFIESLERWHIISDGYTDVGILPHQATLADLAWYWNIVLCIFMFAANIGIKKFYEAMQRDEDNERLARENIEAEMYYLKHQINPHFLMNTLNNIHALVDIDADVAKQAIIQLSDMMRYVVYETSGNSISLRDDIKFLRDYIELMRIRYTEDVEISFTYPEQLQGRVDVPPLIFIVFVENAFKHGVSYNTPSYIKIDIKCEDGCVVGHFENSVNEKSRNEKPGIGLENVRKRLDLIYEEDYTLDIEKTQNNYCVTLKIPILNGNEMYRN